MYGDQCIGIILMYVSQVINDHPVCIFVILPTSSGPYSTLPYPDFHHMMKIFCVIWQQGYVCLYKALVRFCLNLISCNQSTKTGDQMDISSMRQHKI